MEKVFFFGEYESLIFEMNVSCVLCLVSYVSDFKEQVIVKTMESKTKVDFD